MTGVNFHGELQDVEGPDRTGRAGAFDGELALDLASEMTEPSVVGAFVGATLAYYRESEENSDECEHSRVTQKSTIRLKEA